MSPLEQQSKWLMHFMSDEQEQWRQDAMSLARLVSRLHVEMDCMPGKFVISGWSH